MNSVAWKWYVGRSFQVFLGLVALIVMLIGAGVWWMGYALVDLGYLDGRRSEPMLVLDLAHNPSIELVELLEREEAQVLGPYAHVHTLIGRSATEYERLLAARMLAGSDIVKVVTSSEYRNLEPQLLLASFDEGLAVAEESWRDALVFVLVAQRPSVNALVGLMAQLEQSDGRVVWDASVRVLTSGQARVDGEWNRLVLIDFATAEDGLAWLRLPNVVDERAIANSRANDLTLSVFTAR